MKDSYEKLILACFWVFGKRFVNRNRKGKNETDDETKKQQRCFCLLAKRKRTSQMVETLVRFQLLPPTETTTTNMTTTPTYKGNHKGKKRKNKKKKREKGRKRKGKWRKERK